MALTRVSGAVHVCRFDSAGDLRGKKRTYENVKAAALNAGRYSVFEATENDRNAALFSRLARDPDVVIFDMPYPWIGIRRREES